MSDTSPISGHSVKLNRNGGAKRGYNLPSLRQLVQREEWMESAACRGMAANIFFPARQGGDHATLDAQAQATAIAKAICAGCPVKAECLEYATANGESMGIWGGVSARSLNPSKAKATNSRAVRLGMNADRPIPHGTVNGYVNFACRCDACRTARHTTNVQRSQAALESANL